MDAASRAPTPIVFKTRPAGGLPRNINPAVVMPVVPADPLAGPVKSHAKPQAKAAVPDDKTAKAADAKSATPKTAIPDLRETPLNY